MITNIAVHTVLNSLGQETLQAKVWTDNGSYTASVPSGTSKGALEAKSLPPAKAIKLFSSIRKDFISLDEEDWVNCDILLQELDGTKDFSKIGGNLSLAISLAVAKAATNNNLWQLNHKEVRARFPLPVANIIGGGKHGGGADWQEFLIIPHSAKSPAEAARMIFEAWKDAKEELEKKGLLTGSNREGALTAKMDEEATLEFMADLAASWDVKLGVDFAATSMWDGRGYFYSKSNKVLDPQAHAATISDFVDDYKLYYLEDPFHENDFKSHAELVKKLGRQAMVVGDDLYTTNASRLKKGLKVLATSGMIIKPNQIGTLYQTKQAVDLAAENGIALVPSHRSVETSDSWIVDLAITFDAPLIKIGLGDIPKFSRMMELWTEIPDVKMASLPAGKATFKL
jgi:enolase